MLTLGMTWLDIAFRTAGALIASDVPASRPPAGRVCGRRRIHHLFGEGPGYTGQRCWPWPLALDVLMARKGRANTAGARPTSCGRRWVGCAAREPEANSRCGLTAASTPMTWWPSVQDEGPLLHRYQSLITRPRLDKPGWKAQPVAETSYPQPRRCGSSYPGEAHARFPTGPLRLQDHAFITDREPWNWRPTIAATSEIENAIRDLKYGVGLNHLPSGRFAANGAWLAVQVIAHNLARWTARIGLGEQLVTTKTLRRRFFSLAGRLTRSELPPHPANPRAGPDENQFNRALARFRAWS